MIKIIRENRLQFANLEGFNMKKHRKRFLALALSVLLVLPLLACRQNPEPGTSSAPVASTPSSATPGTSAPEPSEPPKLDARPDSPVVRDLGTAAQTSDCQVAETENGFYMQFHGLLYYADKSDLSNWVPVCNKPNCNHDRASCTAYLSPWSFWLRDGRIYSVRDMQPIDPNSAASFGICSCAADGTDFRVDLTMEDVFPSNVGGSYDDMATPDALYQTYLTMDNDGNFRTAVDRLDRNGRTNLLEKSGISETPDSWTGVYLDSARFWRGMYGDPAAYCSMLAPGEMYEHLYRITPDGFEEIKGIDQYELHGAKLVGDGLYYFVPDDGYYYVQLSTGASIRWMDAQLSDSIAYQFGTDGIFERTHKLNASGVPELRWFDGTQWRTIAVPEGLSLTEKFAFNPVALCRDQLLLAIYGMETDEKTGADTFYCSLYVVDLTADELVVTPCYTFTHTNVYTTG